MKYLVLISFTIFMVGCASQKKVIDYNAFSLSKEELAKISVKAIFTTDIDKSDDPIDDVTEYSLNKKVEVISYLSWFELNAQKEYYVKIKWYSPNNEIYEQNDYLFTPSEPTWYSWHYLTLQDKLSPLGKYTAKIFLNNELVKEMTFNVK